MRLILVIDGGTTAFKAAVFDESLRVLGLANREFDIEHPQPGQSELDADAYWSACVEAVRHALHSAEIDPQQIAAVAVTSHTDTLFALDASGRPVGKAILWTDPRAQQQADDIQHRFGLEQLFHLTGQTGASSVHFASRLAWFLQQQPRETERVRYFLQTQDFLLYRLSGQAALDHTIASCSLLGYLEQRGYWREMLDVLGIAEETLSRIIAAGEVAGTLTAEAAHAMGLPKDIPVVAGAMDAVAAQLALGNRRAGMVTEITGAALVIGATCDAPTFDAQMRVPCFAHAIPDKYLLLPWCETAGSALQWYRNQFFAPWVQDSAHLYEMITAEAAEVPAGSDGVLVLPHFAGSGSPDFNPEARAAILGLTLAHQRKHISRALLESIAFLLQRNLDLLAEMGVPITQLVSAGGGSKSALWCRIKADVTGYPVVTMDVPEATATGAALLAGQAMDWWTLDSAPPVGDPERAITYHPRQEVHGQYSEAYRRFLQYEALMTQSYLNR